LWDIDILKTSQKGVWLFTLKSISITKTSFYGESLINNKRLEIRVHPGHRKSGAHDVHPFGNLFSALTIPRLLALW
jgi:hypothetical protein